MEWIFTLLYLSLRSLPWEWHHWLLLLEWISSEPDEIPLVQKLIFTLLELESSEIHSSLHGWSELFTQIFKDNGTNSTTLLKHPGQRDPENGPLGPNSIPGQRWPGKYSTWREIWPRSGSIWPHYLSLWLISGSSLTRNGVWPQRTLFRVTADPGVFRV